MMLCLLCSLLGLCGSCCLLTRVSNCFLTEKIVKSYQTPLDSSPPTGFSEVQSSRGFPVCVSELWGNAEELKKTQHPCISTLTHPLPSETCLLSFTWPTNHITLSCSSGASSCSAGWGCTPVCDMAVLVRTPYVLCIFVHTQVSVSWHRHFSEWTLSI